ncbi:MAG: putative quinol monooxygenase [Ignavibacteriales bacterium]|nr:putative quinol monooxygenase [Ignavibacteriales bacterium]
MSLLTIMAKFTIKQNANEEVRRELLTLVEPTRKEKGCVDYIFYEDLENPLVIMLYENWESVEDLDAHMYTRRFKDCFAKIDGLYEIEVHRLSKIN